MPLDIETAIYNAVAAITAYPAFTALSPPVLVITDAAAVAGFKRSQNRGLQDYPQIRIEMGGGNRLQNVPRVFGQNAAGFTSATCNHPVPSTVEVNLIVIHDVATTLAKQQAVEVIIDTFLHSKWPKLGLTWLAGFTVRKRRGRETSKLTNNVERTVSRWTVVCNARPLLSQLTA